MRGRTGIIFLAIFSAVSLIDVSTSPANSASTADADIKSHFDIPAEPLDKALRDFAVQANLNISYDQIGRAHV